MVEMQEPSRLGPRRAAPVGASSAAARSRSSTRSLQAGLPLHWLRSVLFLAAALICVLIGVADPKLGFGCLILACIGYAVLTKDSLNPAVVMGCCPKPPTHQNPHTPQPGRHKNEECLWWLRGQQLVLNPP